MYTCSSWAFRIALAARRTARQVRLPIAAVISLVTFLELAARASAGWRGQRLGLAGPAEVPRARDARPGPFVFGCGCASSLTSVRSIGVELAHPAVAGAGLGSLTAVLATAVASSFPRRTRRNVTGTASQADQAAGPERPLEAAGQCRGWCGALVEQGAGLGGGDGGRYRDADRPAELLGGC